MAADDLHLSTATIASRDCDPAGDIAVANDAPEVGQTTEPGTAEPSVANERARVLGARLREIRRSARFKLADVAAASGGTISEGSLSTYERGDRSISAARLAILAGIYGLDPGRILSGCDASQRTRVDAHALVLDVRAVRRGTAGPAVCTWCEMILDARGTPTARTMAVRSSDHPTLAAMLGVDLEDVAATLVKLRVARVGPSPRSR